MQVAHAVIDDSNVSHTRQIPNPKSEISIESRRSTLVLDAWNLVLVWNLVLGN
jgi:hypothetical protein